MGRERGLNKGTGEGNDWHSSWDRYLLVLTGRRLQLNDAYRECFMHMEFLKGGNRDL